MILALDKKHQIQFGKWVKSVRPGQELDAPGAMMEVEYVYVRGPKINLPLQEFAREVEPGPTAGSQATSSII